MNECRALQQTLKVLAGRPQDDQDVQGLIIAHGANLDWQHCLHLAEELGKALDQDLATRVAALRSVFVSGQRDKSEA